MSGESTGSAISVILPTRNRAEMLAAALDSLARQDLPPGSFEVLVVDDGSRDHTESVCRQSAAPVRYVRQATSGTSLAKNLGIFMARSPVVFFADDDDLVAPDLLRQHVEAHREFPQETAAFLGFTTWAETMTVTPVMHFITDVGQFLFAYRGLDDRQELDFRYFWTGRISCKRSLLVKQGIFDERMLRLGDVEIGYRLSRLGLQIRYWERARSFMARPLTFDEFCRRAENVGRSRLTFTRIHPVPEILEYCEADQAENEWRLARELLGQQVNAVKALEVVVAGCDAREAAPLMPALWNLYGRCFRAFAAKGFVEARDVASAGTRG